MGQPLLLVNSLARPGGNVTGLSSLTSDLAAKRLELMRELVPGIVSVGAITNRSNDTAALDATEMDKAAKSLGVEIHHFDVRRSEDLPGAFEAATKLSLKAMLVQQDALIQASSKQIVALAAKHRLPALYLSREYVADGGLMGFGVHYPELYGRAAVYVDKIMKGAKPGDLPIEQPTRFSLVINAGTAKALGIVVPRSLLIRADEVID
jgi:putative ABC transport system substrate-binding protein